MTEAHRPLDPATSLPATTAIVADDDDMHRNRLVELLAMCWPNLRVSAECGNGIDAWDAFLEYSPRLCFLDIRMPGLTGFDVARRIASRAHVVFCATPNDRTLPTLQEAGASVLIKPISPAAVESAAAKLAPLIGEAPPDLSTLLDSLIGQTRRDAPLRTLQAAVDTETLLIPVSEVIFLEADARQTRVVHTGGVAHARIALKELVALLDAEQFLQIHRSFIVNRAYLGAAERVEGGRMVATLRNRAERLPVSSQFQTLLDAE